MTIMWLSAFIQEQQKTKYDCGFNKDSRVTFHSFHKKHRAKRKRKFPYQQFEALQGWGCVFLPHSVRLPEIILIISSVKVSTTLLPIETGIQPSTAICVAFLFSKTGPPHPFISPHEVQSIECFQHGIALNLSERSFPHHYPENRKVVV